MNKYKICVVIILLFLMQTQGFGQHIQGRFAEQFGQPQKVVRQPQNIPAQIRREKFAEIKERGNKDKAKKIKELKSMLKSRRVTLTVVFPDGAWGSAHPLFVKPDLPDVKAELRRLKALRPGEYMPNMVRPLHLGNAGVIRYPLKIFQIIGKDEFLAKICYEYDVEILFGRVYETCKGQMVYIHGIPTMGLMQDEITTCETLFLITGTYEYITPFGARRAVPWLEVHPKKP